MTLTEAAFLATLWLGTFLGTLAVGVVVLVRLPPDHFSRSRRRSLEGWPPALRLALIGLKNLAGIGIIAVGVVLSIPGVPGQGLVTILIGLMLLDFPGKVRLEGAIVRRPSVLRMLNRLRRRFGRADLEVG